MANKTLPTRANVLIKRGQLPTQNPAVTTRQLNDAFRKATESDAKAGKQRRGRKVA